MCLAMILVKCYIFTFMTCILLQVKCWHFFRVCFWRAIEISHNLLHFLSIGRVLANLYLSPSGRRMAESWSLPGPAWPTSKLRPSTNLQNAIYQKLENISIFCHNLTYQSIQVVAIFTKESFCWEIFWENAVCRGKVCNNFFNNVISSDKLR